MPLTPEDVRNKQFTTVRLREGYDEDEVDAFLDEVESELTRLLRENEDLRAKLAAATRAAAQNQQQQGMRKPPEQQDGRGPGAPVPAAISGPPVQQQPPQMGPPQLPGGAPQLPAGPSHGGPQGQHGPGPMQGGPMGGPMGGQMGGHMGGHGPQMPQQGPGGDSAARVLSLAQQTADQAIAEARSEANKIVGEARSRAEGLERDARAKADALERDAQEKHRVAMGSLESARATLERKVEDLRGFEREYRTRLKSYLESQLRQLETQADDSLAPPRGPSAPSLPSAPSMAPAGAGAMGHTMGGNQSMGQPMGGNQSMGGAPSYGGQQQMSPAMTQPMAPVRPQAPQPMQQAPSPMRGFLIDEDDN
ncbi:DivIVA domain-containing protein [Streptomyces sp. ISL-1]|uniref:DivIVA domain-containing protein n=1 Tax=Streptomyces sp. ISL-1 TaxID=2817657 RepID=UPI001BEC740C|nr:DivIVA domain-containing protein [Streptomyces sp. ISL-1]MBT2392828.1 DivIVA domain-containing protein [Streptomyces sp. ISL-1]